MWFDVIFVVTFHVGFDLSISSVDIAATLSGVSYVSGPCCISFTLRYYIFSFFDSLYEARNACLVFVTKYTVYNCSHHIYAGQSLY